MKPRTKKALQVIGLASLLVSGFCAVRAATLRAPEFDPGPAPELPAIDVDAAAARLSAAVAIPTVSIASGGDRAAFDELHAYLRASYPNVHARLDVEEVGPSRIFRWRGRDPSASPILVLAHLDVVPVEPGTEDAWTEPAFSGAIANGFVWGRGALDDKASVIGLLEAIELLLAAGYEPRRTIVVAFGHDEEVGGEEGAAAIAARLRDRGERFAFVLDEGGAILDGGLPGLSAPVAFVGVAEKGYASIELTIAVEGGHSSMPPDRTAIGRLGEVVAALERNPMPVSLRGPTRAMLDTLAPHMRFGPRLVTANLWLFDGLIARVLATQPASAATVRTTTAPTIFSAGSADNVLAAHARAIVNFRILPGETVADVLAHVHDVVDDPDVTARCIGVCRDPSPVSRVDGEGFAAVRGAIEHVFPGVLVTPYLVTGGTDARHYVGLSDEVFRFLPLRMVDSDRARLHGTDERIAVDALEKVVRFYATLLSRAAQ